MPKSIRHVLVSVKDLIVSAGPFVVIAICLLWLAYWWLDPSPPKRITLATGPSQSAYAEFGARYAKALAVNGIEVVLIPTEGSSANLQLLREGRVDLGFVQGGSAVQDPDNPPELVSLGQLFVEPVWLFYREASAKKVNPAGRLGALSELQHMRVNMGPAGTGVPNLMATLLEANRVDSKSLQLSQLEATPATVALLEGKLDAVAFASAPESLIVQMLLQTPGIRLMDFAQNEAYSRRLPFLTPVVLPRGVVDLAGDQPTQDTRLIATTTAMLAHTRVHPALLQLVSQTTLPLHGSAGWFNRAKEFPKATSAEFELAPEAERTLRAGVPALQRYLPFYWANLVERMWLALGIIVAVLLPLGRIAPPLYEFRVRSRVFRWYGQLRELEDRWVADPSLGPALLKELQTLEEHVEKIVVPLSYTDELYSLRNHIEMVRQKLLRV